MMIVGGSSSGRALYCSRVIVVVWRRRSSNNWGSFSLIATAVYLACALGLSSPYYYRTQSLAGRWAVSRPVMKSNRICVFFFFFILWD